MPSQPFTRADLERAEGVVKRLHGVKGFEGWAELLAKEFAADREQIERANEQRDDYSSRLYEMSTSASVFWAHVHNKIYDPCGGKP